MKSAILGLIAVLLLASLPLDAGEAHGRRYRGVSVGIGIGYPFYPSYGYYPRSYVGINVWPRHRYRRVRTERRGELRNQQLYIYPAAGQSADRLAEDRYQCRVWTVDATDYDPTLGAGSRDEADAYRRAFTACMEGRDYVVK